MKNVVAIILARGGSKGIHKKNIINFCNKPLISWSIQQAKLAKGVSSVWVSSDSEEILKISKKYGANIIKRPKSISANSSTSESGWLHAINDIKKTDSIDLVIGIQPTSPLRMPKDIEEAIKVYRKLKCDSLFSASRLEDFLIWKKNRKNITSINYDFRKRKRRQINSEQFVENGSFYIFRPENLRKNNNRLHGRIDIFEMEFWKSFEIDSYEDLELCEILMRHYLLGKRSLKKFN